MPVVIAVYSTMQECQGRAVLLVSNAWYHSCRSRSGWHDIGVIRHNILTMPQCKAGLSLEIGKNLTEFPCSYHQQMTRVTRRKEIRTQQSQPPSPTSRAFRLKTIFT